MAPKCENFIQRIEIVLHSSNAVSDAINTIPPINAPNCLIDSLGSFSCNKSGKTVTKLMWRKPPAVNGIIQEVLASV